MKIIPAIDLINGQCVRLSEGAFNTRKTYYEDPLEAALAFETAGLTHLHLVDLDGAKSGSVQHWNILQRIATETSLSIDFSGGIKTDKEAEKAFELGASKIAVGSLAVKSPEKLKNWLTRYGPNRVVIGADIKNGSIATHGWQRESGLSVDDFISNYLKLGASAFLCTDVSKDGKLEGPSTELYRKLLHQHSKLELIASGGVSNLDDLKKLRAIGCASAIVGKAIYENRITLEALVKFDRSASEKRKAC